LSSYSNRDPCLDNFEEFISRLKAVFGNSDATFVANHKLRTIKQKRLGDVENYILEFNRYADESFWNEEAKMDAFLAGLNEQIATKILEMFSGPSSLFNMQIIASRIDSRISTHKQFFNPKENLITFLILITKNNHSTRNLLPPNSMVIYRKKKRIEGEEKIYICIVVLLIIS